MRRSRNYKNHGTGAPSVERHHKQPIVRSERHRNPGVHLGMAAKRRRARRPPRPRDSSECYYACASTRCDEKLRISG